MGRTRLTNGFSKKALNLFYAESLHFIYYNFCRIHKTFRMTPAMKAGVTDRLWEIEEIEEIEDIEDIEDILSLLDP
jgi:hypothetical protein